MKKVELDEIPLNIIQGKMTKEQAVRSIYEIIYTNPGRFNLLDLNEDERSDFLLSIYDKYAHFIQNYDSKKSLFGAYIFQSLQLLKVSWKKKKYTEIAVEKTFKQEINEMYNTHNEQNKDWTLEVAEKKAEYKAEPLQSFSEPLVFHKVFEGQKEKSFIKKDRNKNKLAIVLALKSAWYMGDEHIEKVSSFCNIKNEVLSNTIYQLKDSLDEKAKNRKRLLEKRDTAWYFMKVYKNQLECVEKNSNISNELKRKLNYQKSAWERKNYMLSKDFGKVAPSNNDIAKIIGTTPSVVSSYLSKARKMNWDVSE